MNDNNFKIAGIVVAYNINESEFLKNINTYIQFVEELIVVDNSDNNVKFNELINIDKIKYITLQGNKGIARALNVGIEYAIKNNYDFVLTMDQDSKFNNNIIEEYKKNIKDDVIIYSPNYIIARKKRKKYRTKTTEMYWTMTSGNLLNLHWYKKVGVFREDFFIDGVDYEYCLRARKMGYRILQCNEARLNHNPGITKSKKLLCVNYQYGYMSPIRMYYQVRNLSQIAKEYNSFRARIIILVKLMKIILLFENKKEFLIMFKKGREDFKNKTFGKLWETS